MLIRHDFRCRTLALVLVFTGLGGVFPGLPESSPARRHMLEYMTAPIQQESRIYRETIRQRTGEVVFFRTYEQRGNRYYAFMFPRADDSVELATRGTWVVRRRLLDGAFDQIKIFLQNDEGSFIRIAPAGRTAVMDVEIAGVALYQGVPVPMSLRRILTTPFSMVRESTSGVVDWSLAEPDPYHPGYERVAALVRAIRARLPLLEDADDGAMNAAGSFVYIANGNLQKGTAGFNCSGFAKWVVDGLYFPHRDVLLPIDALKTRHLDLRGTSWSATVEEAHDPFFGLDWTRNLAVHLDAAVRGVDPDSLDPRSRDVREVSSARYVPNVGYSISRLRHVLYYLALHEPGTVYLGSVNHTFGEGPSLRRHAHVVVLFPWFDSRGRLEIAVMERNLETSMDSLERRYDGGFIHLVRIDGTGPVDLPVVSGSH